MKSFDRPKHVQKSIADIKKSKETKKVSIEMDMDIYEDMFIYKLKHMKNRVTIKEIIQKAIKEYIQK